MTRWAARFRSGAVFGVSLGDFCLALVLSVFAAMDTVFSGTFGWLDDWRGVAAVNAVVVPAAALLLACRRRFPLGVLAGVMIAIDSLGVIYGSTQASTSVFIVAIAVYSAAAYGSSMWTAVAITLVGIWVRDAHDPLLHSFADRIWDWIFVGIFLGVGYGTRLRRQRLAAVEQRAAQAERDYTDLAAATAEAERQRIARELHDIVSHSLGLLVFQAGVGEQFVDSDPAKAREAFQSIRIVGAEAVSEMGTILGLIRGDRAAGRSPQPRAADIETLVGKARATGLDAEFEVAGAARQLPAAVELSMYRIAQEALTNAMKHAPNAPVRVRVCYGEQSVQVEIVNRTALPGVLAAEVTPVRRVDSGGRGLIGLAERTAIFGGHLDVGPTRQGQWRVSATLPVSR